MKASFNRVSKEQSRRRAAVYPSCLGMAPSRIPRPRAFIHIATLDTPTGYRYASHRIAEAAEGLDSKGSPHPSGPLNLTNVQAP